MQDKTPEEISETIRYSYQRLMEVLDIPKPIKKPLVILYAFHGLRPAVEEFLSQFEVVARLPFVIRLIPKEKVNSGVDVRLMAIYNDKPGLAATVEDLHRDFNPLDFGSPDWMPELATNLLLSKDGKKVTEVYVQPRNLYPYGGKTR